MEYDAARAFITEVRALTKRRREHWDESDPACLLELCTLAEQACATIEELLDREATTYQLIALDAQGQERGRYPVASLSFRPGDVLVVQIQGNRTKHEIEQIRAALGQLFPPERVLIVSDDVRFLRLEAQP